MNLITVNKLSFSLCIPDMDEAEHHQIHEAHLQGNFMMR